MHGRPTTRALSPVQAGGQSQSIPLWIAGLLALLFLLCVAKLCLDRNDSLSIITLGLAAAVLPLGVNLMRRERRKTIAEKTALAREVEQHNRFFESSLDLILVTDSHGKFARVSPSSKAILGYEPDEMVGHVGTEFIHPDDLDATRREMQLARRGREMRNFETRYVHKSGEAVPLTWTGVWSEAEHLHFFIGRDMSVQKRLEQAEREAKETLAAVIDASPVAIFCLDPQRKVLVWSRAAEQMFGYSARETIGRPYMLVPPDGKDEYDDLFERALTGETLRDIRVTRNRKDGSSLDISFDAAAMYEGERVKAIAYALMDITERNKLEQQLRQSQKLDAIGQLTGGVAHDFNNVLSVVTGTIDILADGVADKPELVTITRLISDAADRGAELTGRLLAFARKQPLQPRKTDVRQAAEEAANLLRPTLGDQMEIEWRLQPDTWPAMVDPAQLVTAILNLSVNARDAMPGGGKLTIETGNATLDEDYANAHSEVQAGQYSMVAVSDTGNGVPEAIREKVFEPFFTTKDVGKGTGLGLSMVYGFVKQSNGHIKLYSEEGHGTTFKIYLPRADGQADELENAPPDEQLGGGRETILAVEDDPRVRLSVTTQLESLGYNVLSAANPDEALRMLDIGVEFDLLFTDVIMPGSMNGRQLAQELKARRGNVKVLFTSGYTEHAIIHHGRLDPGVLLLNKPYRKADLAKMIRKALNQTTHPAGLAH